MAERSFVDRLEDTVGLVLGYVTSAVYGLCFVFRLVKRWVKDPSDRFWVVKNRELPPECLNDPALGNHAYIQLKNVKLHYVENGDRSKPLMLFLHGFPEFWFSWRHQLKEFSLDYWVVAVDMRGYGDSEKPNGRENYRMDCLVADIKNLIGALGKDKCTLVAHDWGGCVAWFLVLKEPQLFDSYVIINSIHPIAFRNNLRKNMSQLEKSWYVFFFQLPCLPELFNRMDDLDMLNKIFRSGSVKSSPSITDSEIEAYKFYFGKPGAFTFPIHYYRANFMLKDRFRLRDLGKNPDLPPGLILFGEKDMYIDKAVQEETTGLVANTTLVCIKDANHFAQQDDPVAVNREMRKFFTNLKIKEKSKNI